MPFNLFRKKKEEETEEQTQPIEAVEQASQQQKPEAPTQETEAVETVEAEPEASEPVADAPKEEPVAEPAVVVPETPQPEPEPEPVSSVEPEPKVEAEVASKMYLKAMPLRELDDVEAIKKDVKNGNILILRVTPLAGKSIEDVKKAVNDLYEFTESIGGDIARLGEERVVICPKNVRVWREKKPGSNQPISKQSLPTAA